MIAGTLHSLGTRRKMSKAHQRRVASRGMGQCSMCGSKDHTFKEHQRRAAKARLNSEVWRKVVVEVNRKIRLGSKASKATRRKMSKTHLIIQNLPEMKALRSKCSKAMWAKRSKREIKAIAEKISLAQIGRKPGSFGYRCWYVGCAGKVGMRSTWEVKFALKLDKWKIGWKYESKGFNVGRGRWAGSTYYPDFYIPEYDLYVEVKGYLRADNRRKLNAFKRKYPETNWMLLDKDALEQLGVL